MENTDSIETPGPQNLETFELLHGEKEDTKSKEARLDQLFQDFQQRIESLLHRTNNTDK